MPTFNTPVDGAVGLQLASGYTAGSGSFVLKSNQGLFFTTFPTIVTLITNATYNTGGAEVLCQYTVTGKSGDTLTGATAVTGFTDQNFLTNDYVEGRVAAKYITDLNAAVGGGSGSVTSVATGTGLSGGPITSTGTISLASISALNLLGNTTGSSTPPSGVSLTSMIDAAIGNTQGGTLYRSASAWSYLAPGTNGQVLTTAGAAANPSWTTVAGGGSGTVNAGTTGQVAYYAGSGTAVSGETTTALLAAAGVITADIDGSTITFNLATSNWHSVTLSGSRILAVSSPTVGQQFTIVLIQDSSGNRTVTWFSGITWVGSGVPPTLSTVANDIDILVFKCVSPGAYYGFVTKEVGGGGTVTNIATGPGLVGGPISTSGTVALATVASHTVMANTTGGTAAPAGVTLTSLVDAAIASTQGDVLYRGSSVWSALAPGTSGQVLTSGGAAANPSWTTLSNVGTVTSVATGTGLTGGPITASGTVAFASVADKTILGNTSGGSAAPGAMTITSASVAAGAITADSDGATITFNLASTNWHSVTLGGNRTLALSSASVGQQFTIVLIQGAGSNTVTWFTTIKWAGGSPPTLSAAASAIDVFTFKCVASNQYYGFVAGQALA